MFDRSDIDRLQIIRSPKIGPVTYRQLISRFKTPSQVINALPDLAMRGGGKYKITARNLIEKEMEATAKFGGRYLFLDMPEYPKLLAQLDNAPAAITWRGNLKHLEKPCVAMVGARNASASACKFARDLAHSLGKHGYGVSSGLARGIDTAAHVGSIESGTIAVIAGGLDVSYPPENKDLQEEIAQRGLLLAEQPMGTEPRARHFPFRNRIIAGLGKGTVVVEAAPRSGSLITARLAAEAGREVMAIPGSPIDPRARGCNQLIREGATLVQDANDIAELLSPIDDRFPSMPYQDSFLSEDKTDYDASDKERSAVNNLLSYTYVSVDELVRQSGTSPAIVQLILLELELAGRLERGAGQKVRLTS